MATLLAILDSATGAAPTKGREHAKAIPLANSFGVGVALDRTNCRAGAPPAGHLGFDSGRAWQRHPIDLFCRAGSLTPPGFSTSCILT
jgi:hypothetical protein